jgi:adenylyltransferase/sulfurtransferase
MSHDLARYQRQMLLPGFGEAGQRRLAESTALVLGCGALGSVAVDLLARAGVGHLVIVDRDFVELSNLQRQVLFDERDVADALPKAEAARRKLASINSAVDVTAIVDDVNHSNIARFAAGADVLVDGLDNLETRYLANDFAVKTGTPFVYGAAVGTVGMAFAVLPHVPEGAAWDSADAGGATPCFRCLFEQSPSPGATATCDTAGVIGSATGIVANFQVTQVLKILTGHYARAPRTLLNLDLWSNELLQLDVAGAYERGDCPCCRQRRFEFLDGQAGSSPAVLCGRNAVQLRHRQRADALDLDAIAARLKTATDVSVNEFMLRAHIAEGERCFELTLFPDGRAIIKGTDDVAVARGIHARYIGA